MKVEDILNSDLSDSKKLEMIRILKEGSVKELNPDHTIYIGDKEYKVELATTDEEKQDGLSRVKELKDNEGMLFIYEEPTDVHFTMEDTSIPLDICFINSDLEVIEIHTVEAFDSEPVICEDPFQYVLEVKANSPIDPGDELDFNEDFTDEEKEQVSKSKMLVLDSNGDVQFKLEGGERIFSRIFTRKLIKTALKAFKSDSDMYYKKVGKMVFKELDAQDSREKQYVEAPN